jgi:hypothetical protein
MCCRFRATSPPDELALAWKHRGDAISPSSLHRRKDTKFVVNQNVVLRRNGHP